MFLGNCNAGSREHADQTCGAGLSTERRFRVRFGGGRGFMSVSKWYANQQSIDDGAQLGLAGWEMR